MWNHIRGDITAAHADIIVSAATTELIHEGGVACRIAAAAGESLERESREIGRVPLGSFTVTSAGNLRAKKVIHIPTVDPPSGKRISYGELEVAWHDALAYADVEGYRSIAMPLLGCGLAGLDRGKVESILMRVAAEFPDVAVTVVER